MTTQNICSICGANYEYLNGRWRCPACGAYKAEELSNEEVTLLYSANQKLRLSNFFEAEEEYSDIIEKYPLNPNGYWGRLLAKCGIKYEEDFDGRKIPTCYAASIESVIEDSDYLKAIELADAETRLYFKEQAEYIEKVCQEWLKRASKEKPYDVFICYKDSDLEKGIERTQDSIDAHEIYTHLLEQGYRVFFSRESLRDKVGEKYEPYIFNALSTAKVMLVYGSSADYIKSTWLKNEWHRFYKKVEAGEKHHDALLVACSGFSPNELPKILSSRQCFDARRKTFFIDLDKSIKRIIQETVSLKKTSPKESTIIFSGIHEHKYTEITVPATCIAKGYTIHRCDCGYEYRDSYTPLVDHSFNVESRTNPTCTSNGVETKACKVCGESITTTLPALGHQFTTWTECKHPTCTEDGEAQRQCKRCGTIETKTVPQTGHQFTRWSEFPTETSYCVNCGLQKTRNPSNRTDGIITNGGANTTSDLITSIDAYGTTIASKRLFNIYTTYVELIEQGTKKSCFRIAIADIASFEKLPMLEVIRVNTKANKSYDIKFGWPKRTQEAVRELSKLVPHNESLNATIHIKSIFQNLVAHWKSYFTKETSIAQKIRHFSAYIFTLSMAVAFFLMEPGNEATAVPVSVAVVFSLAFCIGACIAIIIGKIRCKIKERSYPKSPYMRGTFSLLIKFFQLFGVLFFAMPFSTHEVTSYPTIMLAAIFWIWTTIITMYACCPKEYANIQISEEIVIKRRGLMRIGWIATGILFTVMIVWIIIVTSIQ